MGRSLLLLVSGFLIIFGIIQNSVQNQQQVLQERAPEYYYQEQSRNIAGAMLEIALGNLNSGTTYLTPNSIDDTTIDMLDGVGTIKVDSITNFQSRVYATISGEIQKSNGTASVTDIKVQFARDAFSIYAYFTDVETNIWFTTGDVLNGPVHTNGTFHIEGTPVFNGPISSHGGVKNRNNANAEYNGGKDFNAKEIELPTEVPEVVRLARTENGGIGEFDKDIFVEFKDTDSNNNTGTVEISEAQLQCVEYYNNGDCKREDYAPKSGTVENYNLADFNGVISSNKIVYAKGKVDGTVTLHSKEKVEILGDLVYENRNYNDKSKTISDDRLGIISEGDTVVDNDAHAEDSYGNNSGIDLYIDASILSLGKRFHVQDYNKGGRKGKLHILGGLIQRERGTVGDLNGNGYYKDYQYDTRLLTGSTPGFPHEETFNIKKWRESTKTLKPTNN